MTRSEGPYPESRFFGEGLYKKTEFIPKSYKTVEEGCSFCGEPVDPRERGRMKMDAEETLRNMFYGRGDHLVETKFNGHRGILEYRDGDAYVFSEKGIGTKTLPLALSELAGRYLSGGLSNKPLIKVKNAILDGELFVKECLDGDEHYVPEIGIQSKAIKGDHPELAEQCKFSFQVFDIIELNGKDISSRNLEERKETLRKVIPKTVYGRGDSISIEPVTGVKTCSYGEMYKKFCESTGEGHEGIVIKELEDDYLWRGIAKPSRKGWYKLKREVNINAYVEKACLGKMEPETKTNRHSARYKDLTLTACKYPSCEDTEVIGKSSINAAGGPIGGWDDWDRYIHSRILALLRDKKARPEGGYRRLEEVEAADTEKVVAEDKLRSLMGCDASCHKDDKGRIALPICVTIPRGELAIEAVTTEINKHNDLIRMGGPPRVLRVVDKAIKADSLDYLRDIYERSVAKSAYPR